VAGATTYHHANRIHAHFFIEEFLLFSLVSCALHRRFGNEKGHGVSHGPPRPRGFPGICLVSIRRVFGHLKTWLRGTHHGVGHTHLQAYLDEFTFRFNRRRVPMAAFQTLSGLGSQRRPTTYKELYGVESSG
jgi:hypothetical protein